MAEAAIAIATLASAWAMSKDNKKEPTYAKPPIPINYPHEKSVRKSNPNKYAQPANQTTDKFFRGDCSTTARGATFVSLTGEEISDRDFTHNNCVPFFGARVKGASVNSGGDPAILDAMAGTGSQQNRKKEIAPLFAPQKDLHWTNGMPDCTDFYRSRTVPSTRMANIKPFAEKKEAPGLGADPNALGGGYNTAVQDRNAWLPKTVSELRVLTNPKQTYGLQGHEGPAARDVKDGGSVETQGIVNKNRPDTDYTVGPSRWFTTTGAEIGETQRPEYLLQPQDRGTCATNYYGVSERDGKGTYINSHVDNCNRVPLCAAPVGPSITVERQMADAKAGYENKCNNRAANKAGSYMGPLRAAVDSMVSPVVDVIRHTRKTNAVGNKRGVGNPGTTVQGALVDNSQNRVRTTLKEQTVGLLGTSHLNLQAMPTVTTDMSSDVPKFQHRNSTAASGTGIAGPAAFGAQAGKKCKDSRGPNTKKCSSSYFPAMAGARSVGGPQELTITKLNDTGGYSAGRSYGPDDSRPNSQRWPTLKGPSVSATYTATTATTKFRDYDRWSRNAGEGRIDPNLLSAFKANPYTHSLTDA